jgi:hypothetical protein
MKVVILLLAVLISSPVYAKPKKESGFTKILRTMFPSAHPKLVPRKRKHIPAKQQSKKSVNRLYVTVEIDWMARYWEEEAAWDYYIPEDDLIRFVEGKYVVPIVVYKHNEDMQNTPRRTPTPTPAPIKLEFG